MKPEIHPQYHKDCKVTCACGNAFTIGSTVDHISVEVCSSCHPFYTDKQKIVDTAGRVNRFKDYTAKQETVSATRKGKKAKKEKSEAKKASRKTKA